MSIFGINYSFYGLVALAAIFLWRLDQVGRRPKDYPPGPPTLPIFGNLLQIPQEKRHLQFEKWAREYGPIYSLMLGTKVMIVLSSDVAIKDLIDKRGAIYSSRPEAYIAQDILSGGLRVLFMACIPSKVLGAYNLSRTMTDHLAAAKCRSLVNGPQVGAPYSECDCCTNIRSVSGPGEQSHAPWYAGTSE